MNRHGDTVWSGNHIYALLVWHHGDSSVGTGLPIGGGIDMALLARWQVVTCVIRRPKQVSTYSSSVTSPSSYGRSFFLPPVSNVRTLRTTAACRTDGNSCVCFVITIDVRIHFVTENASDAAASFPVPHTPRTVILLMHSCKQAII
jgi:hypothetical protein